MDKRYNIKKRLNLKGKLHQMNGETSPKPNEQSAPQAEEWQSLQTVPLSSEMKQLVQEGIYDLDQKPTEDYLASAAGQKALSAEEKFNQDTEKIDRYLANLQEQVNSGAISEDQAQKYREAYLAKQEAALNEAINQIDGYRQDYIDSQVVGTPETEWIDSPEVFSREEVLESAPATEIESTAASASEKEAALADEKEKEAALADEKAKDLAQAAEKISTEEAEIRAAEHQDMLDRAEALLGESVSPEEAERRAAEHQSMIERAKHIEAVDYRLNKLRTDLAELFVKKSRILGPKHRAEFDETKKKYEATLDEYLRLQPHTTNEEFLENYLEQDQKLLDAVEDRVDNGNLYRKIISRTLGNEYYKEALLNRGVESLGVTGAANAVLPEVSPEPVSQPVAQPKPQFVTPSNTSSEAPEAPVAEQPTSSQSAAEANIREQDQDDYFVSAVKSLLNRSLFSDEDIDVITMKHATPGSAEQSANYDRVQDWWDGLNSSQQDSIIDFMNVYSNRIDSGAGGVLNDYLRRKGLLN